MKRAAVVGLLLAASLVLSSNLPIRLYTTADGLPHNWVTCIRRDAIGYLWFGTREGLARFDGYSFTSYGRTDGLVNSDVTDLLVSRAGDLWVATSGGLFRFQQDGQPRFMAYPSGSEVNASRIRALAEDRDGSIWMGTAGGLYRLEPGNRAPVRVDSHPVLRLLADRAGSLWIAAASSVSRRWPDGRMELQKGAGNEALLQAMDGSVWIGGTDSLMQLDGQGRFRAKYSSRDGLRNGASILFQTSDGRLWIDSYAGLSELQARTSPGEPLIRPFGPADRMTFDAVRALGEDKEGNLWIGCTFGAMKVVRNALTSYDRADGLGDTRVASIFEDHEGKLYVITTGETAVGGLPFLNRRAGERFVSVPIRPPNSLFTSGWNQIALFDREGAWWAGTTTRGICRYHLEGSRGSCYGPPPNGQQQDAARMFEDSRGGIWTSIQNGATGLMRWDPGTGLLQEYTVSDGIPARTAETAFRVPSAFREDRTGAVWIGASKWIARYRQGRFQVFDDKAKFGNLFVTDLHLDDAGRLWIAGNEAGLYRVDKPEAEHPVFTKYTAAQGLSGDRVLCVTSDRWGRIYVCTGRGIDRLDPDSTADPVRTRHYTVADGLTLGTPQEAFRDREGTLWFGSLNGLSSLKPEPDTPREPPPVLISSLHIQGVRQRLSELGKAKISGLSLSAGQNQIEIGFVGLGFAAGETLRYQFKLGGSGATEWSAPTGQRSVNYANLAPGRYTFEVRAMNSMAQPSVAPAVVEFTVLAPIWQRWWFLSATGVVLGAAIYLIARYRLKHALALERVRMRIATDLHDDVGSSLSQIAILSEVMRDRNPLPPLPGQSDPLERIADISRELTDSISDIVWAISPRHDKLLDLTRRMREFAEQMLVPLDLALDFQADIPPELRAGAEVRRQVYLIFKECVHNIVRHAGCKRVIVRLTIGEEGMLMSVADDGCGFEERPTEGNGLRSIRQRAENLGGRCIVESTCGQGTNVTIRIPARALRQ